MRNAWRLATFDVLAPLAALTALFGIGAVLAWPRWWVAVAAALALLIVEGVVINFWLLRRDRVTVGTDDDAPGLRLAVAVLAAAALCAAVLTGYTHWTTKDEDFKRDSVAVVQVATGVAEAVASFSPTAPGASIDRAASMMVPEKAGKFKEEYTKTSADLLQRKVTAQASTLAAGVEAIGPTAASVAVIMRVNQSAPGQPPSQAAPAVRVTLTKRGNDWLVQDIMPIHSR
jgi:hypothetical protein